MIAVLLTILKWTGIVFLCFLCLILFLLCLFLFVPVRYRVDASVPEVILDEEGLKTLKSRARFSARISWLLYLIRGAFDYPDAPHFSLRPKFLMHLTGGAAAEKDQPQNPYEVFLKIEYTISSVCDKIGKVRTLLESETFARAKDCVLQQAACLFRGVTPRKCRIRLFYGTGDPCLTAEILAAYGMLFPLLGTVSEVRADFERRMIAGDVKIRGRVRLITVLKCGLILYFNRDIRTVRAALKKMRRTQDE